MTKRPLVLVSPSTQKCGVEFEDSSISLSNRYGAAIVAAGGIPVVFPGGAEMGMTSAAVERCDGVLLTGGNDVETALYASNVPGALLNTVSEPDRARDLLELELIDAAFRYRKPLLAICRGHQMLNVALGGDLIIDLRTQQPHALEHNRPDCKDGIVHEVTLTEDSLIARIMGRERLGVNSSHHQAAGKVPGSLQVTGRSSDGMVESLELRDASWSPFLLAVQFHPERLVQKHPHFLKLFKFFIRSCSLTDNQI